MALGLKSRHNRLGNVRVTDRLRSGNVLTPRVPGLVIGVVVVGGYCVSPSLVNAAFEASVVGRSDTSSND